MIVRDYILCRCYLSYALLNHYLEINIYFDPICLILQLSVCLELT
jgi:hypothetical protein